MGKRGPKPKFTDVSCPNQNCKFYCITGKGNIIGNGTYQIKNKRVRKYICLECGRVFNDRTGTFFDNLRKDEFIIKLALKMAMRGMSTEGIAEVLEIRPSTVSNWLLRAAEQCEKVNEELMKDINVSKVEMDELWVIIKKKVAPRTEIEDDGAWMWVSFAPESRLIIDFKIGPRKQCVADELIEATDKYLSDSKPLFITDGLKFYAKALLKKYGEWIEFPKTGKRGRPKKPRLISGKKLKYAKVVKIKQGKRLKNVKKEVVFGENIDQKEISTSLLERQNLTFRQDNNRISRKTIGFSKETKSLYNQMRLYCTHFNFCRTHMGLTKENENGVVEKKTPAQESGITKRAWTLTELLNYRFFKISTN